MLNLIDGNAFFNSCFIIFAALACVLNSFIGPLLSCVCCDRVSKTCCLVKRHQGDYLDKEPVMHFAQLGSFVIVNIISHYLDSYLHKKDWLHRKHVSGTVKTGIKIVTLHRSSSVKGKKMTAKERIDKLEQDKNERRKVFKELVAHVEQGSSLDCFALLSANTIRGYLKTYPEEFVEEELQAAMRKGRDWWEHIGRRQAAGDCLGNSRTWFYNMAIRFGCCE